MIVRAASADALVHVPRGDGEIPADGRRPVPRARLADAARRPTERAARWRLAPSAYGAYRPKVIAATCAAAASQTSVDEHRRQRDVADRRETDRSRAPRPRSRCRARRARRRSATQRPGEPGCEEKHALPEPALDRQPEPRVERREHEHEGIRLREREHDRDDRDRAPEATARPASRSSGDRRPSRSESAPGEEPGETNARGEQDRPPIGGLSSTSVKGESGSDAPVGSTPPRAPSQMRSPRRAARARVSCEVHAVPV